MPELLKPGHAWPHRFLLRDKNKWHRVLDIQVSIESSGGISVYMRTPMEGLFATAEVVAEHLPFQPGKTVSLDLPKHLPQLESATFNPYISWHGSGVTHANVYTQKSLKKEKLVKDVKAIQASGIKTNPVPILTAILPLSPLGYYETSAPPPGFDGVYMEVSKNPHMPNKPDGIGSLNMVLDRATLRPGCIVLDILVHHRDFPVDIQGDRHPYPADSEMYFVALPIQVSPHDESLPAVTFFMYQPVGPDKENLIEKKPIILWGRSIDQKEDFMIQGLKIT